MGLLVVGSVAFDTVRTPFGAVEEALGGSATYFSTAASYFVETALVAVVGDDFPEREIQFLKSRGIDVTGLQRAAGATFRWQGEYGYDLNEARTLDTQLNVFEDFHPVLPEEHREKPVVFLANIDPDLQREVLEQVNGAKLVACDTMNFWIEGKRDALIRTLGHVDMLVINDGEARELGGDPNLVKAAAAIRAMGPDILIVKRGEYGVIMFGKQGIFAAPAYPLEQVFDPTGAGDSFAGGLMGYLANTMNFDEANIRKGIIFGSVMASFNVEDFSLNRLRTLDYGEVERRYREFRRITHFEDLT